MESGRRRSSRRRGSQKGCKERIDIRASQKFEVSSVNQSNRPKKKKYI